MGSSFILTACLNALKHGYCTICISTKECCVFLVYVPYGAQNTQLLFSSSALSWDITQRIVAIPYGRFETTYLSHLQGSSRSAGDEIFPSATSSVWDLVAL